MSTFFHVMVLRIRAFFRPGDLDRDFDQELETHLAMAEDDNLRRGMTPEQARRAPRVELGGLTELREAGREARGLLPSPLTFSPLEGIEYLCLGKLDYRPEHW